MEARQALSILLKALQMGTRFNIYRFGNTFSSLFESSVPYNAERLDVALNYLSGIDADLGGTEILAPLRAIQQKIPAENAANIILLTDGEIGNEEQVSDLVRAKDTPMRMFTLGIGNGPNEYFIKQLARITGGAAELISPNERMEPKVLRLFTKVSSAGSIHALKVDWGTEVLASDIPSSAYFGETVSIFAKLDDANLLPGKILVSGITNKMSQEWAASIIKIDKDNIPAPLLWARTKIREFEESSIVTIGSLQFQRKENKVKLAIISLSKKYGIISRETSFVAVEKRIDAEKTTGEVVLRKVPVMLTKDWGGAEKSIRSPDHKIMATLNSLKSENDLSVPAYMRYRGSYRRQPDSQVIKEMNESLDMAIPAASSGDDNGLLGILALQKAEGGFEIDSAFAKILKVSLSDLHGIASKIQAKGKPRQFVLLSTAIVLNYLEHKYADKRVFWEGGIQKSRIWFEKQILQSSPIIELIILHT